MDTCYFLFDQYNDNYMYSITVYNNYTIYACIMYVGVCACVWMRACVRACVGVRRLRRWCFLRCYGCSNRLPMASTMPI